MKEKPTFDGMAGELKHLSIDVGHLKLRKVVLFSLLRLISRDKYRFILISIYVYNSLNIFQNLP